MVVVCCSTFELEWYYVVLQRRETLNLLEKGKTAESGPIPTTADFWL